MLYTLHGSIEDRDLESFIKVDNPKKVHWKESGITKMKYLKFS